MPDNAANSPIFKNFSIYFIFPLDSITVIQFILSSIVSQGGKPMLHRKEDRN